MSTSVALLKDPTPLNKRLSPKRARINSKNHCREIHKHYVEYGTREEYDEMVMVQVGKRLLVDCET